MVRTKKPAPPKTKTPKVIQYCGECAHCYDHHSKALDGRMILGKCPYKEHSVFLRHDHCEKFKPKT